MSNARTCKQSKPRAAHATPPVGGIVATAGSPVLVTAGLSSAFFAVQQRLAVVVRRVGKLPVRGRAGLQN
jgi:hypothetical protein